MTMHFSSIYNCSSRQLSSSMSATRSPRLSSLLQSSRQHYQIHSQCSTASNRNNVIHHHRNFSSSSTTTQSGSSSPSSSSSTFGKIFFPSLCAITFTLGTWQTKRYFEKITMVQKRLDDLSLEPLSLEEWRLLNHHNSSGSGEGGDVSSSNDKATTSSYRRVTIQGKFDHTNSILIGPRGPPPGALATSGPNSGMGGGGGMSSSMQGYWVVTPLIVGEVKEEGLMNDSGGKNEVDGSLNSDDVSSTGWLGRLLPWGRRSSKAASTTDQTAQDIKSINNTDSTTNTPSPSNNKPKNIVWINRGWIPRHYINPNTNQILQSWDEPMEHVTVLSMESQTERGGGMFTPPSRMDAVGGKGGNDVDGASSANDKKSVRKLLWMDRKAMEEMTNCNNDDHPPLFVQIDTTTANDNNNEMNQPKTSFPVQPSEEYVGEFKVTPDVHMGYAITWFGLSGAGVIMTRKLLTRGR